MNGTIAYALSKQYVADTADSLGSLKGAPCTIKSITEVDGGQKVTFEWIGTSGTKQTSEMTVKNGVSVTGISDKGNGVFTLLFSDGSESDPIQTIKGEKGDKGDKLTFNDLSDEEKASLKGDVGFSPTITENADNTDKIYKLDIETVDGKFTTPNLKGADGQGGSGGTIDAPINSISVNGVNVLPDENKNVDITVPEAYDDTELIDIRVKADGTTATSAGNAVREQFNELKGEIDKLKNNGTGEGSGASWSKTQIDNLESVLYMMEFSTEALAAEGKTKIDALITSLRNGTSSGSGGSSGGESGGGTEITLTSISAVYNGGEVPEGTSASDLDITVTANYSDGSSAVVTGWSISGTVYEGENSFIVSYGGKTTTVKVTGVKQSATSKYITDGLIFNIDAIDSETTGSSWSDATGNYTTEIPSTGGIDDKGTYINANVRSQVKVTDTALLTDMGTEFSVEAVWQNRYLNLDGIVTDQTPKDTDYIFTVGAGNNNMLIANNGKCRILGSNAVYGDAFTSNDDILHCTITYDGTTYSLYHDGTLVTSMSASMDLSSQTYAEFWGCMEWARPTNGSFNAGRIYNRCLTANEVKANYDVDIERFGTQNIAAV